MSIENSFPSPLELLQVRMSDLFVILTLTVHLQEKEKQEKS